MKLMVKSAVFTALLSVSLFAQNTRMPAQNTDADAQYAAFFASLFTHGFSNGRFWTSQDIRGKTVWLDGYRIGLQMGAQGMANLSDADAKDKLTRYWPAVLTYDEIEDAIDRFYSEPENVPVPVWGAVAVVSFKTGGASPSDVEEYIAKLRRLATQKPE